MLETLTQRSVHSVGPAIRRTSSSTHINRQEIYLPATLNTRVVNRLEKMRTERWVTRLWSGDASLWSDNDEAAWLGWLNPSEQIPVMRRYLGLCARLRATGCVNVVLLGMGGASLGAHVLQSALEKAPGGLRLHVLDTTDPDQILAIQQRVAPQTCLYIVASKSGSTMESTLLAQHFYRIAQNELGESAARHFCAITDPDTPLQRLAEEEGFAAVFTGDKSIGGRYSVLSPFGLVPLALMGHDPMEFLDQATQLRNHCGPRAPIARNPAALLGAALGEAALMGRDKVTLWAEPGLDGFVQWLEQLLAESTGKSGRGLIPIIHEPATAVHRYPSDRLFVILRRGAGMQRQRDDLRAAGQAVIDIEMGEGSALAQEFYRWQFATAVAGSILQINPFDQPDVEASKIRTRQLMAQPSTPAAGQRYGSLVIDTGVKADLGEWLRHDVARYFALLAYLPTDASHRSWLAHWQGRLRDMLGAAATAGFGPRYLHSSGQLHKGGPDGGAYLFLGRHKCTPNTFSKCQSAQAQGDLAELRSRGRHCAAVWFTGDIQQGMRELSQLLECALGVSSPISSNAALAH